MAGNEKTLRETLGEVVGEGKPSNETISKNETDGGISKSQAGEADAGKTPVYVNGVDISEYPAEVRPQIEKALKEKGKLLETGYQEKFKEVATYKKAQQELIDSGLGVDEAKQVLNDYLAKKKGTSENKVKRTLDTLIDNSPAETRASLEQLRKISREEGIAELLEKAGYGNVDDFVKDLKGMRQTQSTFANTVVDQKKSAVNDYLDKSQAKYGKGLIEKYHDAFYDAHLKYNIPIDRLVQTVIPLDELEQALTRKTVSNKEKANAVASQSSGFTGSEAIDVKKTPMKSILSFALGEARKSNKE